MVLFQCQNQRPSDRASAEKEMESSRVLLSSCGSRKRRRQIEMHLQPWMNPIPTSRVRIKPGLKSALGKQEKEPLLAILEAPYYFGNGSAQDSKQVSNLMHRAGWKLPRSQIPIRPSAFPMGAGCALDSTQGSRLVGRATERWERSIFFWTVQTLLIAVACDSILQGKGDSVGGVHSRAKGCRFPARWPAIRSYEG
ncbi:hypothetical protein BJY04DRAFT_192779 [Aspergillus karnatakaensis]|uniref:uncharacterized protein n=1 Tax=Aspergillus karnatakaensis TaxID=1810916 RepID=UPI003CCCFADD